MTTGARTSSVPGRSLQQRRQALERANAVRAARAKLKGDLAAGRADLAPLVLSPPEFVASAKVVDLLVSLPKIGKVKAHRILSHARIAPNKTLGGLTGRQRGELLNLIQH